MPPVDRFSIQRVLSQGAWSTVYLAHDQELGRDVALKVFRDPGSLPARRALEVMGTLEAHHQPGLAVVHHLDPAKGLAAMELITGGTLRDRWQAAPGTALDADETSRLATGMLETLAFVHALGVVHGDLSARNIVMRGPGQPVMVDFAGWIPGDGDPPGGTPAYLAPERWTGGGPSAAGDLFSVGALLWEAVTGARLRTRAMMENGGSQKDAPLVTATPAIRALVTALIATDPGIRPCAAEALTSIRGWPPRIQ